ncbi:MAG: hypothetical protein WD048_06145, partial [Chitinophagales bacterium]
PSWKDKEYMRHYTINLVLLSQAIRAKASLIGGRLPHFSSFPARMPACPSSGRHYEKFARLHGYSRAGNDDSL